MKRLNKKKVMKISLYDPIVSGCRCSITNMDRLDEHELAHH
ncbi:hypothetical protein PV797_03395 [Clostridiaceae bacterium M8S5]|nr:hypothetical protein PV797_03395 [Clostridiaceae bacterium M8S5]